MDVIFLLIVAAVLGGIGARLAGQDNNGCFMSIVLGLIGAMLGRAASTRLGIGDIWTITLGGTQIPVLSTIAGSAIFVALLNVLAGKKRR
ncbi:MAG: hypothetical protein GXP36_07545 [Actinobacteria bacterium]|nr:hypothetical protein [Actinomycetota bacterium]